MRTEAADLSIDRARDLAYALLRHSINFAEYVETRKSEDFEIVILDVDVERPQHCFHQIERKERIAVKFFKKDDRIPEVLALRTDFPSVPHLNLHLNEIPRSLCLYQENYADIKRRWTSARFVARIRTWLALTAKGLLHSEDQPLEPILLDFDAILLMPSSNASIKSDQTVRIIPISDDHDQQGSGITAFIEHYSETRTHGVIHHRPKNLSDLIKMVGSEILTSIRDALINFKDKGEKFLDAYFVIIVHFPTKRRDEGPIETIDTRAFRTTIMKEGKGATPASIRDLGEALGIWQNQDNELGFLISSELRLDTDTVSLDVLNPIRRMDQSHLAFLNGKDNVSTLNICSIGVGALGSQLVMNLARAGYGKWVLIDDDKLLPHNTARHFLTGAEPYFVGEYKVNSIANLANSLTDGDNLFQPISVNILYPSENREKINQKLRDSDIILDMSASVTVARHLTFSVESDARRISIFLTPSGTDLVCLAEDSIRNIRLDQLEMQYYRACIHNDLLDNHLDLSAEHSRYGQSCRDLTSRISQHVVALHAAIGAKGIEDAIECPYAQITIWRAQENGTVRRIDQKASATIKKHVGSWTVITDRVALEKIFEYREKKLPNETGGMLLGSFDTERHLIYIVDTIPSPPDSEEWPPLYIRGLRGLPSAVDHVTMQTDGMLEYIGEWHSHPNGTAIDPSEDDKRVFEWLAELMDREGLPPVMIIAGDKERANCMVCDIQSKCKLFIEDNMS